jgi:rubrerythrin
MKAILQICVEVEERVGEIYQQLVNHPEADAELREIWQEMADDEVHHAHRIRLVGERFETAGVITCSLSREGVQELSNRANEILQDAQKGKLALDGAISASVELEDAFLAVHLGFAASGNQPDLQTMFKTLAEADREHTMRLKSYLNRANIGDGLSLGDGGKTP